MTRGFTLFAATVALILAGFAATPIKAQQIVAQVVTACGSPNAGTGTGPNAPVAGGTWPFTEDTTAKLCTNAPTTAITASATSGVNTTSVQVANNTTSVAICTAACNILGVRVYNNASTIAYAKLYNATQASTTCGSGTPKNREMIPSATTGGAGAIPVMGGGFGVNYSTAAALCVTTGFADADTTAPAATTYIVEVDHIP